MISLFRVATETEPTKLRTAYLRRLAEIADGLDADGVPVLPSSTETTIREVNLMNSNGCNGNSSDYASFSTEAAPESANGGVRSDAEDSPAAVRKLAEEIAPKFTEAFTAAAATMYRMAMDDRSVLEEAVSKVTRISEQLDNAMRELRSIREVTASLSQTQMGLSSRVAAVESSLENKVYLALEQGVTRLGESLRGQQHATETKVLAVTEEVVQVTQRLETQASAIRTLHDTLQDQLGRREQLKAVLDRVTEITSSFVSPKPLPDQL